MKELLPLLHEEKHLSYFEMKSLFKFFSGDELSSSGYESIEANINCISNKKPSTSTALTSFSNPNYLCPGLYTFKVHFIPMKNPVLSVCFSLLKMPKLW